MANFPIFRRELSSQEFSETKEQSLPLANADWQNLLQACLWPYLFVLYLLNHLSVVLYLV